MIAPRLIEVVPELASELERLLSLEGEASLAAQVDGLLIIDRCRCGDDFCSTIHTAERSGPKDYTIALVPKAGMLHVDVIDGKIVQVEVLYRDDLQSRIIAAADRFNDATTAKS